MATEPLFHLPAPIPSWPPGNGFGSGVIKLGGGLQVCQVSNFRKIWATQEGGSSNKGATFYEPASVPGGFFVLGHYGQSNDKTLDGWVLLAKEDTDNGGGTNGGVLMKPVDFTLVWNSASLGIKQDGNGYIWRPTPPNGYAAVGCIVSTSASKPPLEAVRCVRTDLTDQCQADAWIWGPNKTQDSNGLNIFSLRPGNRGIQGMGVAVGTFDASPSSASNTQLACLKNINPTFSSMPNVKQIQAIFQAYSPCIYLHPDEKYHPSSVTWYFSQGALLFKRGETNPVQIDQTGSNLPQGGGNDGEYWIDLPADKKDGVKRGDLQSATVYLHVKPMLGGTFTDLAMWVFYPFNGPGRAKVGFITVPFKFLGQHACDWEHITLRVSNFNGELKSLYCSAHSGGSWVPASELEFYNGSNKPVTYSSLNGHAMFTKAGVVMQGSDEIGLRNDTAKSNMMIDAGSRYELVAAEYLGQQIVEPPWLNYLRVWGPKVTYDSENELKDIEKHLPGNLRSRFDKFIRSLPKELLGEEGPTGPKVKRNWAGDEI